MLLCTVVLEACQCSNGIRLRSFAEHHECVEELTFDVVVGNFSACCFAVVRIISTGLTGSKPQLHTIWVQGSKTSQWAIANNLRGFQLSASKVETSLAAMPTSAESTAIEASCRASHSKSQQERERELWMDQNQRNISLGEWTSHINPYNIWCTNIFWCSSCSSGSSGNYSGFQHVSTHPQRPSARQALRLGKPRNCSRAPLQCSSEVGKPPRMEGSPPHGDYRQQFFNGKW